jgi:AcrR family transcriptional regulator
MAGKRDKREAILKAMLDLVVERGFDNAPMSVLAKRSGASPGVIYHYFPSKDDLIHAVHERVVSIKHEVFFEGVSPDESPREALLRVWLNAYRFYRSHRKETRFLDQYLNSSYCGKAEGAEELAHPESARILKCLTLGLAASLAKAPKPFSPATLKRIAETVWNAIADE